MKKIVLMVFALLLGGCDMANNITNAGATGGVSIISYLQKQRDGVVFQETFENSNFLAADGWTTLRGTPANTQAQAVAGISSWDNSAGNQSMPIAQKVITDTNVDSGAWLVQGWFYDPLTSSGGLFTTSAYPGPYLKVGFPDNTFVSVGVRNSVSTSTYSYSIPSLSADAPTLSTGIARSPGWHNFQIYDNPSFGFGVIQIDNLNIATSGMPLAVSKIYVSAGTSSDSGQSFGYFDNVAYYRNRQLFIKVPNPTVTSPGTILYDSSNNIISQSLLNGTPIATGTFGYVSSVLFPQSGYFEIPNYYQQGTSSNQLLYRTPLIQINPGDIYQLQSINFGRKVTIYDPFIKELQSVSMSTAGVRETNNYGLKGPISFSINSLQGWSWKQAADNFFLNAVQGNPFNLMVDNNSDNAFGVIATSAFGGETSTVQIMRSILGTASNTTTQFTVGNYYYVRNNTNTQKQLLNLVSMTTSTLTFDQNLNFNVNPLDYVYSLQLYPFLETVGDTQTGFKCDDPAIPRFKWSQACQDYNNG